MSQRAHTSTSCGLRSATRHLPISLTPARTAAGAAARHQLPPRSHHRCPHLCHLRHDLLREPRTMDRDAHNDFVRRLSTWIPAALTRRGWLIYPERLNRTGVRNIIEHLWTDRYQLSDYLDAESAARLAHIGQRFKDLHRQQVSTDYLDQWLTDRFPPIAALAEAITRIRDIRGEEDVGSVRDNVALLPPPVQALINDMSTDPLTLQAMEGSPRITHPEIVAANPSQESQAADDDDHLSQVLSQLSTPSQDARGRQSADRSPRSAPQPSRSPTPPARSPVVAAANEQQSQHSSQGQTPQTADRSATPPLRRLPVRSPLPQQSPLRRSPTPPPSTSRLSPHQRQVVDSHTDRAPRTSRRSSAGSASPNSSSAVPRDQGPQAVLLTGYVVPAAAVRRLVDYSEDEDTD